MMNNTTFRNVLMLPGLICGVCGCQEEVVTVPAVAIDIPQEFSADGAQWTVIEMGASEERVLGDFFAKNDDLMGSPDFQGYPSVFVSSTQDLRFYWLHPAVDGCRRLSVALCRKTWREIRRSYWLWQSF